MSDKDEDDGVQENDQTPEQEKKKRTFAGATHILKAEAIRQLDLSQQKPEDEEGTQSTEGKEDEISRPLEDGVVGDEKGKGTFDRDGLLASSDATQQLEGGEFQRNGDSNVPESTTIAGSEPQIENMNNSEEKDNALGDDSVNEASTNGANKQGLANSSNITGSEGKKDKDIMDAMEDGEGTKEGEMTQVKKEGSTVAHGNRQENSVDGSIEILNEKDSTKDQTANLVEDQNNGQEPPVDQLADENGTKQGNQKDHSSPSSGTGENAGKDEEKSGSDAENENGQKAESNLPGKENGSESGGNVSKNMPGDITGKEGAIGDGVNIDKDGTNINDSENVNGTQGKEREGYGVAGDNDKSDPNNQKGSKSSAENENEIGGVAKEGNVEAGETRSEREILMASVKADENVSAEEREKAAEIFDEGSSKRKKDDAENKEVNDEKFGDDDKSRLGGKFGNDRKVGEVDDGKKLESNINSIAGDHSHDKVVGDHSIMIGNQKKGEAGAENVGTAKSGDIDGENLSGKEKDGVKGREGGQKTTKDGAKDGDGKRTRKGYRRKDNASSDQKDELSDREGSDDDDDDDDDDDGDDNEGDDENQDGKKDENRSKESIETPRDEVVEEEKESPRLPEDFFYNYDDIVSKPDATAGVPSDMLQLYHSFGFECTKRSNIHMLDIENVLFAAGNVVQILNIKLNTIQYIRSVGGGGIGAIAVHPSRKYFAIAEKGEKPNIMIYEYPSLRVYRILREGTEKAYANLDFTPDGKKLASVGSAPDYMLTVWDWINEKVELRSKAFSQDIYNVAFSPENEGHLCTSGTGHIKFWTMATTFTGLKLQGELGRFGTTELSDIAGFVELPDGKVLSGSEWGNMLLWDGGLIKAEIARKGKKTCHQGMIEQFFLDEGELITIGIDGCVKVWDFESIDTAEAFDESKIFEMEPMSELKVGPDVKLVSMVKSVSLSEASIWYAQDASGGIWKLDLSFSHVSQAPKRLFSYHAGAIKALAPSSMTHLSATAGSDHTVRLYDYLSKTQLCHSRFSAPGTSIIWMPKTVDPDGLSILAGFDDGVIRQLTVVKNDANAVATKKDAVQFELKLAQVFKPHVKAVTSLAVSKDGKFLATGSDDSTVFFFSIEKNYKPIGFIETGGGVVSLDWSSVQQNNNLLICCKNGSVFEISCPKPDDYDTTKTYLIPLSGLKRTEFKFKSIKDKLVKEEDDLRKAKEEEERRKQKEEEKRKKEERGIVDDEEEEEDEDAAEEEAVAESPKEIFHEDGQIVNGFYKGDTGNFWLLLDGWDAGYIYECAFTKSDDDITSEPLQAIKFDEIYDVPVRSHCFSKTSQYMPLGLDDGSIRVQILESREISKLDNYWSMNMHDNHYGAVTGICLSFDEKFLLSVGNDGNFFVYSFMDEEKLKTLIGKHKAEVAKQLDSTKLARIDDIEDSNHYSIELEKQKAEHDRMVRLAEEKKQLTRQTVNLLRSEFKRLVSRNQKMPSYLQLPPVEFIIDPNMKSDLEAETKAKLSLVEKEMAWESEKHLLSLRKLEMRFKDMIECELFKVHAFKTQHTAMSYRATALPPEFNESLEENRNRNKLDENEQGAPLLSKRLSVLAKRTRAASKDDSLYEDKGGESTMHSKKSKSIQKLDGKVAKAIEKAELNRKRRLERKAKWDELFRSKPDLDYEDPAHVAAIKEAQENMGHFKLKSAVDYIVPEKERVNADKKRCQITQLKEQIYQIKRSYNEKLLNLRDRKISIIAEVKSLVDELEDVQNGLPLSMHVAIPPVPMMQPDEQPESLFHYTSETLKEFKKGQMNKEENVKQEASSGGFGGGFGGFGTAEQTNQPATKMTSQLTSTRTDQRGRSMSILSTLSSQPRTGSSVGIDHGSPETISEEVNINDDPSDMEMKVRDEQRIRLAYRRDMLLQKINDLLLGFDAELRILRHEKILIDVDLKNANLRMITLFEELVLLKEFEKRENVLMGKVSSKMQEKDDMEEKVEDCQLKMQMKKGEIENLQEKEQSLSTVFSNLFVESNKFEAFLTKVYKKKVKRTKKTEQDADSDEDSDEDLSDDDYDSEEDENSDAEELDDSVCPPGCDQALFDQVCQLREKRLDLEEATTEEKKAAELLRKELEALKKKAKVIESNLVSAEEDLEAFQREKQQKLNELDIVVTLKLSQLQYLNNNALPQDLSPCLVFTSTSLDGLQQRITGLDKEKAEQKKLYWKLRQQHVTLIRDKKSMEVNIQQLEEKVQQMQMLKFGRLVDLEKLETISVNRPAEELKEQLRAHEFSNAREIAMWEKRIDDAKARLTQVTRENTRRLDTYTVLLHEKKGLEQTLDSRQKNLGGEFQGNRKEDFQERQRLVQLAQLQSQEIDALKEEIGLLSRKGGHILPPSQAHVPNSSSTH